MRIAPPPSMPPESSDWTAPPAAACRMCTVSMENSRRIHVLSHVTDWTLWTGICMAWRFSKPWVRWMADVRWALDPSTQMRSFQCLNTLVTTEIKTDPSAINTGEKTRSKGDKKSKMVRQRLGTRAHNSATTSQAKPWKVTRPPMAKATLDRWFWDNPTLRRVGRSRSISARLDAPSSLFLEVLFSGAVGASCSATWERSAVNSDRRAWASSHLRAWMRSSDPEVPAVSTRTPLTLNSRWTRFCSMCTACTRSSGMLIFSRTKMPLWTWNLSPLTLKVKRQK